MGKNGALKLAGLVFGLVFLVHLLRLLFSVEVIVAGYVVPLWVSGVGLLVSLILCVLMFSAARKIL